MKLHEIRLQFEAGAFKGCSITRPLFSNEGYILIPDYPQLSARLNHI